ncbi:hypothetical protein O7621_07455 [Solwaraspora sp. WMMD937]|uniref:hypothetical protein n=1 Tax=Solwaraspora sp. WMMD937 TaxID=3016090 RepID=UPI00249CD41E|nr:hypothetical protein [Solwaraspora sp. WMMD937]WFE23138.1 hypothetical protein O7621_07455 [Solwaraspora sp. WMMD937]
MLNAGGAVEAHFPTDETASLAGPLAFTKMRLDQRRARSLGVGLNLAAVHRVSVMRELLCEKPVHVWVVPDHLLFCVAGPQSVIQIEVMIGSSLSPSEYLKPATQTRTGSFLS